MGVPTTWEFKTLDNVDYELVIKAKVKRGLFSKMFRMVKRRAEKKGAEVSGDIDDVSEFDANPAFFNLAKTACLRTVREATADVRGDGVNVLNGEIKRVFFKKEKEWLITIIYRGQYEKC